MRLRLIVIAAALACLLALPAAVGAAAKAGSWSGQATSKDGSFKYGKVTFKVKGSSITNLKIEGVTVSGCGGYKTIFVPKVRIKGSKFTAIYQPDPEIEDTIRVRGTISGSRATGTFAEGPLCEGEGKFTARAK